MKSILTIAIFLSLVVSGATQTRNVVVGTNGAVVSPTNFWSADVTNARSGLGLGTAATSAASAFQPSSVALSNLAAGNGGSLTNITATIVGTNIPITNVIGLQSALDSKLATNGNTTGTASNVTGVVSLANGGTGGSNASTARAGLGASFVGANIFTVPAQYQEVYLRINADNTVSSLSASNFRTAIGASATVGTVTSVGMTVPSILSLSTPTITSSGTFALTLANQTSRHALLAPNGGGVPAFRGVESDDLPSLAISKITGLQTALDGKLATNGSAAGLTSFPTLNQNTTGTAANVTGVVVLANGGTGSTNASGARTALELGTSATNASTAFQSSSSVLTNIAANNGGSLTNIVAANIVGTVGLASNITGTAPLATNVTGVVALANGGTAGTNAASARTGIGATTVGGNIFTLVNPSAITFLRLNADNTVSALSDANFRTAIGLGTAATNPATAFQPSSSVLTNLASSNGANLTNIPLAGVVGALATNGSGSSLTNITAANITGTVALASNVTGTIAISNGGSGATTAGGARTNLGLGATNDVEFRSVKINGVGDLLIVTNTATSATSIFDDVTANELDAETAAFGNTVIVSSNGISFNTNTAAATTRTNLGLGLSALTNTSVSNFSTAIGLGATNTVFFNTVSVKERVTPSTSLNGIQWQNMYPSSNGLIGLYGSDAEGTTTFGINIGTMSGATTEVALFNVDRITFYEPLGFNNTTNAAITRTNLGLGLASSVTFSSLSLSNGATTNLAIALGATNRGFYATAGPERIVTTVGGVAAFTVFSNSIEVGASLGISGGPISFTGANAASNLATTRTNFGLGWSALTNSNAGTGLVSVNTNGDVVSPTNFWRVAPISTTVQYQTNVTGTSTNAATNSRNLFLFSLASTVSGVTNTVTLPTNTATTFEGDRATVVHLATNSANTVTAIRQLGATNNLMTLNQVNEAVLFMYRSGAWALADNISYVEPIQFSGTNAAGHAAASRTNLGLGSTNDVVFNNIEADGLLDAVNVVIATNGIITFYGTNSGFAFSAGASASQFREDLGIPLAALTNTNNANFQAAVFATNTTPTNGGTFNSHAAWMEVTVQTNGSNVSFRIPLYK